jgi:acyl-CoA thioesterase
MCMYCRTFHHKLETTDKRTNKQEKKIEIMNIKNSKRKKQKKKIHVFMCFMCKEERPNVCMYVEKRLTYLS